MSSTTFQDDALTTKELSDRELVRQTLEGDSVAFGKLVERYEGLLMVVVLRRGAKRLECEDLVQESFVRAYRALSQLDNPDKFKSWLCRIASNITIDRIRARSGVLSFDQHSDVALMLPSDNTTPPEEHIEAAEERSQLLAAIETLPEIYQIPFVMHHIEEVSYAQMSKRLGVSEVALRKRVNRAGIALQREIAAQEKKGDKSDV